jgi:hypothetical protein
MYAIPCLMWETCRPATRRSIRSERSAQISEARIPCREANKIIVASHWPIELLARPGIPRTGNASAANKGCRVELGNTLPLCGRWRELFRFAA